jgi:hypothetical protein
VRAREEGLKNVDKMSKKEQATMVISILKSLDQMSILILKLNGGNENTFTYNATLKRECVEDK